MIDALEDTEDYRAFEAMIISDYNAQTAVAARGPRRRNSEHPGADIEDPHGPGPHISPRTGEVGAPLSAGDGASPRISSLRNCAGFGCGSGSRAAPRRNPRACPRRVGQRRTRSALAPHRPRPSRAARHRGYDRTAARSKASSPKQRDHGAAGVPRDPFHRVNREHRGLTRSAPRYRYPPPEQGPSG